MDFSNIFDIEEKKLHLPSLGIPSGINPEECISTGFLCLDLIIGGGLQRGRIYEIVGPEQGGKTALSYSIMSQAIKKIPYELKVIFEDVEGLIDPIWFKNIIGIQDINKIFGKKSSQGLWKIKPQIRYYKPDFGEQGLKFIKKVLKRLPDKVLLEDSWYYSWSPRPPKVVKKTGGYSLDDLRKMLKDKYDKKLYAQYKNFYVPVENNYGGPELLIIVDSWAAMTPEAIVEEDSGAIASQARMFAKHLNGIKSLVASKGCTLIGTNQIRMAPLAYGNPEQNPGGFTLKHMGDCRIRIQSVGNPSTKKVTEEEDTDVYRHFKIKITKNKLFVPFHETVGRWWVGHQGESGFGPDIVLDTLEYLKMTNQFRGKKRGFQTALKSKSKKAKRFNEKIFIYNTFKEVVLGKGKFDLRKFCERQMMVGRGMNLYLQRDVEDE